ncbi:MAG TPA: hypothetical protein DCY98_01335 [Nitrospinae bacterium]|nr:hypothetical protein [Nitrospinota bacterium]
MVKDRNCIITCSPFASLGRECGGEERTAIPAKSAGRTRQSRETRPCGAQLLTAALGGKWQM